MDDNVNKAIKQLETIAIKAMDSGYLDDAAKVMHIAEEIERVDKSGLATDTADEDLLQTALEDATAIELTETRSDPDTETETSIEQDLEDNEKIVALDRFRSRRNQAKGDSQPELPAE